MKIGSSTKKEIQEIISKHQYDQIDESAIKLIKKDIEEYLIARWPQVTNIAECFTMKLDTTNLRDSQAFLSYKDFIFSGPEGKKEWELQQMIDEI